MRLILLILVFVSSLLLAGTTAFAGISTKRQDILKLIGTTYAPNGKFAWIELNGEDYGWTREGQNVGKYKIVIFSGSPIYNNIFIVFQGCSECLCKLDFFGGIVSLLE